MKLAFNLVVLLLFFNASAYAQGFYTVTLNVDTENLTRENAASSAISSFAADSEVEEATATPEDFTIIVENGSVITWEAVSTSSESDVIEILEIERESGPRIFSSDRVKTIGDGKVRALVQGVTGEEVFKYEISFKVNGGRKVYKIDPKIKVGL